jgi:N-acyl homoserine lactone hydrolase
MSNPLAAIEATDAAPGTGTAEHDVSSSRWKIFAVDTGTSFLEKSMLTYTSGFGTLVRIPRVMWVLKGPTTVVVDTSVPVHGKPSEFIGEDFQRSPGQIPSNAMRDVGIDPRDVEYVLLTHLHWDHAGNCDIFPEATVLVQQTELRYAVSPGRFFRRSFLSPLGGWERPPYLQPNLDVVAGGVTVAPGLSVVPAPGHTPGSQAIIANTEWGTFAIAGDAICMYENLEKDLPPGFHTDVDASMDSMDRLRGLADHLLPSHDYEVFTDGSITRIGAAHAARGHARVPWRTSTETLERGRREGL